MKRIREAIKLGIFDSFRQEFLRSVSRLSTTHESSRFVSPGHGHAPGGTANPWLQLIPFALILGIFYFVMVLPMRKRQQKVQAFLAALKVGDRIITTGRDVRIDHAS